jgi:prepilin-type N-terminal cleavage/methylation domain-containing protein
MQYKTNKGFTLIDLLVSIAIITLLSTVVLASLNTARTKALNSRRVNDLKQIQNALSLYQLDHGYFPRQIGDPNNIEDGDTDPDNDGQLNANWFSDNCDCNSLGGPDFSEVLSVLVDEGYISKIPNDPLYVSGQPQEYVYSTDQPAYKTLSESSYYLSCGSQPAGDYTLLVYSEEPITGIGQQLTNVEGIPPDDSSNYYCVTQ